MTDSQLTLALEWKKALAEANELIEAKEYKRALVMLDNALKMVETFGPEDLRIAETLDRIAFSYHRLGQLKEAEPLYRQAIEIALPRLFGRDTEQACTHNLADLLCEAGRADEGEKMRAELIEKYPEVQLQTNVSTSYRSTPENDVMRSINSLARQKPEIIIPMMKELLGMIETIYGADSWEAADALEAMGNRSEIGAEYHERVLQIKLQRLGTEDGDEASIAYAMRQLADSHTDPTFCRALMAKARAIEKKLGIKNVLDMTMGTIQNLVGKTAPQDMPLEEADSILAAWNEQQKPDATPFVTMTLTKEQRYKQLVPILETALEAVFEIEADEDYPLSTICLLGSASRIHKEFGDIEMAKAMLEKEMKVIAEHWGDGHILMVDTYEEYVKLRDL